jgi:GNAT superfamily N-acetyltransferase
MNYEIVPLASDSLGATADLLTLISPDRSVHLDAFRRSQEGRWDVIVVGGGRPVAYGCGWLQGAGRARIDLIVHPAHGQLGIGGRLLDHLLEQARQAAVTRVQARAREQGPALAFLERRGFTETNRMVRLVLNVPAAEPERFRSVVEQVAARGVEVVTRAEEEARCADVMPRIYELVRASAPGRPDPYVADDSRVTAGTLEDAVRYVACSYQPLSPEAFFLARHGDQFVGLSFLRSAIEDGVIWQGDTLVHPDWRRRGIATALKVRTIEYTQASGYGAILTNTASAGMLALNLALGFECLGAEVRLVRDLDTSGVEGWQVES